MLPAPHQVATRSGGGRPEPAAVLSVVVVAGTRVRQTRLRTLLEGRDLVVLGAARDLAAALAIVAEQRPQAVLFDLAPDAGGLDVIEGLMARCPLPIVLTGAAAADPSAALARGAVDVVPTTAEALGPDSYAHTLVRHLRVASRVRVITHPRGRLRERRARRPAPRHRTAPHRAGRHRRACGCPCDGETGCRGGSPSSRSAPRPVGRRRWPRCSPPCPPTCRPPCSSCSTWPTASSSSLAPWLDGGRRCRSCCRGRRPAATRARAARAERRRTLVLRPGPAGRADAAAGRASSTCPGSTRRSPSVAEICRDARRRGAAHRHGPRRRRRAAAMRDAGRVHDRPGRADQRGVGHARGRAGARRGRRGAGAGRTIAAAIVEAVAPARRRCAMTASSSDPGSDPHRRRVRGRSRLPGARGRAGVRREPAGRAGGGSSATASPRTGAADLGGVPRAHRGAGGRRPSASGCSTTSRSRRPTSSGTRRRWRRCAAGCCPS